MTGRRLRLAGTAVLVLGWAGVAMAQPVTAPAAKPTELSVGLYGFPYYEAGGKDVLRRAQAEDADMRGWLKETDPQVVFARTQANGGSVSMILDVGPDGRATGCRFQHKYGADGVWQGLCETVTPRVKVIPAIDVSGARVADAFQFNVSFNRRYADATPGATPRPLIDIQPLPPAPPPPGPVWPPRSESSGTVVTKLDLVKGGASAPEVAADPWAGAEVRLDRNDKLTCTVLKSSGDAAFDTAACKTAMKAKYDFSAAKHPYYRRVPIHFVRQDGKPRGLLAANAQSVGPVADPAAAAALKAALAPLGEPALTKLRLSVGVDATGAVSRCGIADSSGVDATDAAACATVRRLAKYAPAQDIFGRPQPWGFWNWKAE